MKICLSQEKQPHKPYPYISEYAPLYLKDHMHYKAQLLTWTIEANDGSCEWAVSNSAGETHSVLVKRSRNIVIPMACSCKDYCDQQLGTCLHIEAIKRANNTHRDIIKPVAKTIPSKLNHVYFDSDREIILRDDDIITKNDLQPSDVIHSSVKYWLEQKEAIDQYCSDNSVGVIPDDAYDFLAPTGIKPYPYQKKAIIHLLRRKRAILALNLGLGKTLCTIVSCHFLKKLKGLSPTILVICPATLKRQWQGEITRITGDASTIIDTGDQLVEWFATPQKPTSWLICNYELVQRHIEKFVDSYTVLVLDEVQKVRNHDTKTWAAIKNIRSEYAFTLSGTLLENSPMDVVSIMEIINEKEMFPRWKFLWEHFDVRGSRVREIKDIPKFKAKFDPYIFRDSGNQVKLPKLLGRKVYIPMSKEQTSVHNAAYEPTRRLLAISKTRELTFQEKIQLNMLLQKARMVANSMKLVSDTPDNVDVGGKVRKAVEILQEICVKENQKILIYSEWVEMLLLVQKQVEALGLQFVLFHGGLSGRARETIKSRFINDPNIKVFLGSDAAGAGLDGLQLACNHILHTELPWNPSRTDQRNGRLHRILQQKDVYATYLVASDSIESDMVEQANDRKRAWRKDIVGQ